MIRNLRQAYPSRYGAPSLDRVDTDIFSKIYFMRCMDCTFCNDACCGYGADVALDEARRIEAYGDALFQYTQIAREKWFDGTLESDPEFPGQASTQTGLGPRGCIFLNPTGRSCMIHAFCLEQGMDYHALKPMVCCLFPVTFGEGLLTPSYDVDDESLICLNQGVSLYTGARQELHYYFGEALVAELDAIRDEILLPIKPNVKPSLSISGE